MHWLGKLPEAEIFVTHAQVLSDIDWTPLPVSFEHAALAGGLDIAHRDPFDRLLIAQAISEDVALVSNETLFDRFGVKRLW